MAQVPANQRTQGGRLPSRREHPLERLQRDFDTLFDRLAGGWSAPFSQDLATMRVWDFDVTEDDQEIVVRAELPGFEENEIDVQLDNGLLTIKAEKEQKSEREAEYRSFYRSVTLPPAIDPNKVRATYHNGVLELHIPRAEGAKPRRIAVQGQQSESSPLGRQTLSNQAGAAGSQAGNQGQQAKQPAEATASEKAKK